MPRTRPLTETIKELELQVARHKAVLKEFPDARMHHGFSYTKVKPTVFSSKEVNQNYTKFDFDKRRRGLWVVPYCEVKFEYEGATEIIRVHSSPKSSRLAYLAWHRDLHIYVIKFARLTVNMKSHEFKEDMLNSCRAEIMTFIRDNPKYKMDDKHLETRLKKLLVFV